MNIVPQGKQITGRCGSIVKTTGGLMLPETGLKGVTVFVQVEAVGPEATKYSAGQLLIVHKFNHIYLRGGVLHRVIFDVDEVLAVVEDLGALELSLEPDQLEKIERAARETRVES